MLFRMEKAEHGARLKVAMARAGAQREVVADALGVASRTVTNWTTGKTMPQDTEREALRKLFPGYDDPGDPVEVAIMNSGLTEDRRYALVGTYKRMLREQTEGGRVAG
jgi:DNA-binding XRE family transcriptional regulator